jgi:hypothetical protein
MSTTRPLTETERTEIQAVIQKAEARITFLNTRYNQQFALQELENIRAQANALLTASAGLEAAIQTAVLLESELANLTTQIETLRT